MNLNTPENLALAKKLFNDVFPAKDPYGNFPSSTVGAWLEHGNTPEAIANGLIKGGRVLNFPADQPPSPTAGQFTGAQHSMFTSDCGSTLHEAIGPYFMEGKDYPADQYIFNKVTSHGPSVNYDGSPAAPVPLVADQASASAKLAAITPRLAEIAKILAS
jgi:hypothetical protein